jgi:hypothetical protein
MVDSAVLVTMHPPRCSVVTQIGHMSPNAQSRNFTSKQKLTSDSHQSILNLQRSDAALQNSSDAPLTSASGQVNDVVDSEVTESLLQD